MAFTIGQVATRSGVGVETVRYYERRGLIDEPPRTSAGYRQYPPSAVDRLLFIRRAREVDFSLEEIIALLAFKADLTSHCSQVASQLRSKAVEIDRRLVNLEKMKRVLLQLASSCEARQPSGGCPVLDAWSSQQPV